jgi:hypothetical protein
LHIWEEELLEFINDLICSPLLYTSQPSIQNNYNKYDLEIQHFYCLLKHCKIVVHNYD